MFDYEFTTFQRQTLALSFSLLVTFSVSKELCFPFRWIQLSAGLWIDFTMRKTPVSSMTSAANCGFTCTAIAARKSLVSHKAYFKIFLVYGAALKNSVLFLLNIRIQYSTLYEGHYQKDIRSLLKSDPFLHNILLVWFAGSWPCPRLHEVLQINSNYRFYCTCCPQLN